MKQSQHELVAFVSRDLLEPLAGVRAISETLEKGLVDDPNRCYRQNRAQLDAIAGAVDDLLELTLTQVSLPCPGLREVSLGP